MFFSDVNVTHEKNLNIFDTFSKMQTIKFSISLHIKLFHLQFDLIFVSYVLISNQFLQFTYAMI